MASKLVKCVFSGALAITLVRASLLENEEEESQPVVLQRNKSGEIVGALPDAPQGRFWFQDLQEGPQRGKDVPPGRLCGGCPDHALPKGGARGALYNMCTKKFGPNPELCVIQSGRYDPKRPRFTDAAAGMCVPSPWGGEDPSWADGKRRWCDADQGRWADIQIGHVKACKGKNENDRCRFMLPGIALNEDGTFYCKDGDRSCNNGRCEHGTHNGVRSSTLWCNIWNPECAVWKTSCEPTDKDPKPEDPKPSRRRQGKSRRRSSKRRRRRRSKPARRRSAKARRRSANARRRSKKATSMLT